MVACRVTDARNGGHPPGASQVPLKNFLSKVLCTSTPSALYPTSNATRSFSGNTPLTCGCPRVISVERGSCLTGTPEMHSPLR
uniref:(California timema) hypothetical protein n=1 Tax=Timema californicum TaxID=61474 RepID=A0A7R9P7D2_TIMCA|nr:unnamed protein product [Timema californicum]